MSLIRLFLIFALLMSLSAQASNSNAAQELNENTIQYNKSSDHLRVEVTNISLKLLLTKLALQSSLEVLFDDDAEDTISMALQDVTLEQGLKNILKGRSFILQYGKDAQQKQILTGIMVLPKDKQDSKQARRLVSMDDEAYSRSISELSPQQMNQIDIANERWQARLRNLSPERREAMEKRVSKRVVAQIERQKKREEKKLERKQIKESQEARHREKREMALQHLDPQQRSDIERRGAEAHEQIKNQLTIQLQNN
ncbi:MAG TPA: hypothetical protein VIQ03_01210 [Gammaproteobacteria bacterium]